MTHFVFLAKSKFPMIRKLLPCIFLSNLILNDITIVFVLENEDVKRTTLRELKVLRMLKQENIVELK